jgi:mannose-1-phosphate guanylyltransferase/mannose-6-phosphate isomerase
MSKIQPVILSGGSGSRLWPVSRAMLPKQLLPLVGEHTMLQETVMRLQGFDAKTAECLIICNEAHRFLAAGQMQEIDVPARFVLEPEGRNTAPAVALAALLATETSESDDEAPILLIMPADHVIKDVAAFHKAVEEGLAAVRNGKLVTFGIVPTSPHTGYGYIEAEASGGGAVAVTAFVEKPELSTAIHYVNDGKHFWNSGMFMFAPEKFLEELGQHAPGMLAACRAAITGASRDTDFIRPHKGAFLGCPSDSIDYAVMEKTDKAMLVPLDAGWSDVGSWSALHAVSAQDSDGNVVVGDTLLHECRDTFVSGETRLVAAVGVEDMIIVETKDAVLVANKNRSEDVKHLVDKLKAGERPETNLHRQVFRPWGNYDSVDGGDGFQVKRLIVNPGAVLSLQMHHRRAEHWVVVRGTARITLNDDVFDLGVNQYTHIPIGAKHRIENPGTEPLHIIEVQCGDYLGEDDIVRFEDNYGREGTNT